MLMIIITRKKHSFPDFDLKEKRKIKKSIDRHMGGCMCDSTCVLALEISDTILLLLGINIRHVFDIRFLA
jgi:hypothetical protein